MNVRHIETAMIITQWHYQTSFSFQCRFQNSLNYPHVINIKEVYDSHICFGYLPIAPPSQSQVLWTRAKFANQFSFIKAGHVVADTRFSFHQRPRTGLAGSRGGDNGDGGRVRVRNTRRGRRAVTQTRRHCPLHCR